MGIKWESAVQSFMSNAQNLQWTHDSEYPNIQREPSSSQAEPPKRSSPLPAPTPPGAKQAEKTPVAALAISHTARVPLLRASPSLQQATDGPTDALPAVRGSSAARAPTTPERRSAEARAVGRLPLFRACSPLSPAAAPTDTTAVLPLPRCYLKSYRVS